MWRKAWLILCCVVAPALGWAANTHPGMGSAAREQAAWFGDLLGPYIVSGCIPATSGTTTTAALECKAYVRATTGELVYVHQAGHAVGPLDGGDGTYWLAIHRDTGTAVPAWTREPASHYIWRKATTQPATPDNTLVVATLTVASSAITAVEDLGQHSPRGKAIVLTSQFASAAHPIQAAIDALPRQGGTVYVEPGTYNLPSTITIGTGDVGVASSKEGVMLECIGHPGRSKTEASVVLKYTGTAGSPVIAIKGPLVGGGVKNCYIDGNSLASVGVYVQSARGLDMSNLVMEGHTYAGIQSTCVPTGGFWSGATDSLRNRWAGMWIWHLPPAQAASAGIVLNSSHVSCNTDFNSFYDTSVLVSGVDGWGVYLGASDHNMWYNLHIFDSLAAPATRSGVHFAYDNGIYSGWPCANNFYGVSLGETGMSASGTPLANNTCNNSIFGLSGGDPANFQPDLPGVTAVYGDRVSQDLMLIAGRGADNDKPVGDVMVYTHASNPRHLTPSVDALSDLGRSIGPYGAKRWKDLHLLGSVIRKQRGETTSPQTLLVDDYYVKIGNVGGATTLNLLSAVTACGREYIIDNATSNNVVLTPSGGELINGAATFTLDDNPSSAHIISDCVGWRITATHGTH
jgi:hypothetical protein